MKTYHLKLLGKARTIYNLSDKWLEQNIQSLYAARDMKKYGQLSLNKYWTVLEQIVEQRLQKKLLKLNQKKLNELKFKCKKSNSFEIKNTYLEQNIEELTDFFKTVGIRNQTYYLQSYKNDDKYDLKAKLLKMEMSRQRKKRSKSKD